MDDKHCPICNLINPASALQCDCGYDFMKGSIAKNVEQLMKDEANTADDKTVRIDMEPTPVGIGGWLILPAIGLVVSPILILISLIMTLSTSHNHQYNSDVSILTLVQGGLFIFILITAKQFFNKSIRLPTTIICLLLTKIVTTIITFPFNNYVDNRWNLFTVIVTCAIWIPYFSKSKRVKATFINVKHFNVLR